ncbi:MAG: hemerythrin domain-containing protein [Myxococcales bacterium]
MRTVARLIEDHRLIERVCDAFTAYGDAVESDHRPDDRLQLRRFVAFLRGFADGTHHRKEQDVLFPAMIAARLLPPDPDPERFLAEHDKVRKYACVFDDFAAQTRPWNSADCGRLRRYALGYVELLRQHFHDEETVLYPVAEHQLESGAKAAIDSSCEQIDPAEDGPLRLLGEDLIARRPSPLGA